MSRDLAPRDRRPRAEQLRAHLAEMELARTEGCSVLEARSRIATRAADARWQATDAHRAARARAHARQNDSPEQSEPVQPPPWMLFD